jgi:hypothetical protein
MLEHTLAPLRKSESRRCIAGNEAQHVTSVDKELAAVSLRRQPARPHPAPDGLGRPMRKRGGGVDIEELVIGYRHHRESYYYNMHGFISSSNRGFESLLLGGERAAER